MDPTRKWHTDINGPDKIPVCLCNACTHVLRGFVLLCYLIDNFVLLEMTILQCHSHSHTHTRTLTQWCTAGYCAIILSINLKGNMWNMLFLSPQSTLLPLYIHTNMVINRKTCMDHCTFYIFQVWLYNRRPSNPPVVC